MSLFFDRFCQLCKEDDISPNAVAKKLSISSGSITAWKKGVIPRTTTLQKLADYFHVSADYLLGNVNDPSFYLDNARILAEINENPSQESISDNTTEEKLKLLARHLDKIPDEQRDRLIENFENSIDIYLDALGIPKEDN